MITRKRILVSEKQAALIWQQTVGNNLICTEGEQVNMIYPGRTNNNNGPDFRDAVIINNSNLMKGDVEVHVKSSDWYNHEHHTDAEYNNVVLHAVMWHDCISATLLQSGQAVPVLCLAKAMRHQAYLLPYRLPCYQILERVDKKNLEKLLNTAGEERFKQKALYFKAEIIRSARKMEAGQVLYRGLMRALGYDKNAKPFEELADKISLRSIESRDGLVLKQALLLGTAGLLPSQRRRGKFANEREVQKLEQIWQEADKKFEAMKEDDWTLSHIYPNNFPVRRIIALSYLLERYSKTNLLTGILEIVKQAPIPGGQRVLENGLAVTSDGYWQDHFDFGVTSKTRKSALLGNSKLSEIIVNVVLPFVFSWGELNSEENLSKNSIELYRHYPKLAENCITQHMQKQISIKESLNLTACRQQGLIHIFRNYCREGRCKQCPLAS